LPRNGYAGPEQTQGNAAGGGSFGEMENIRIMENISKDPEVPVFPDHLMIRENSLKKIF
jgi:hypothetical protein